MQDHGSIFTETLRVHKKTWNLYPIRFMLVIIVTSVDRWVAETSKDILILV